MSPKDSDSTAKTGRERLAEARAAEAKSGRNRKLGLIAAGVVAVVVLAGSGWYLIGAQNDQKTATSGPTAGSHVSNSPIKGVLVWDNLGRNHVPGNPTYPMSPPVGGDHNPVWANCGVYDKEIPNKYAVHSLEHGAVWITTNAKATSADLTTLKKLANQDYILMSNYPSQTSPVILSAWGHQLRVNIASDPRVAAFVKEYLQGPQTPEPGASCTGGYDPNTGQIAGSM